MKIIVVVIGFVVILSGCSTSPDYEFYGKVEVYGDASVPYAVKYSDEINRDLKLKTFADSIVDKLSRIGWKLSETSDYELSVEANIHSKSNIGSTPNFGVTGYSGGTTTGSFSSFGSFGSYSSTTTLTPTYGITGYSSYGYDTYVRNISINVIDKNLRQSVLSFSVSSEGSTNSLSAIIDPLVHMLYLNMKKVSPSSGGISFNCFKTSESMMNAKKQAPYKDKIFETVSFDGNDLHCAEM